MSYQALARKWRPHTFKEVVGQEHILRILEHALNHERLHHAWLFTGTRGVGKTTLARIFAKSLNCEQGVSATPCGRCSTCQEVDAGRFIDLLEVDAASHTKVDETRQLLENVPYAPSRGRYKVYLIDEVHMLSNHSFNALLKTLEEPPAHVRFLLATTDPQKLPVTVLSRCLQLNLKPISEARISQHLAYILEQEKVRYDSAAIPQLAKAAEGSMRDALSLLDQAIAFGSGELRLDEVQSMLGTIAHDLLIRLLRDLANKDGKQLLEDIHALAQSGADFSQALGEIANLCHEITIRQIVPNAIDSLLEDAAEADLQTLARQFTPEDVQLFYQIALSGKRDLLWAPNPHIGFEMTLLRMFAFYPITLAEHLATPATTHTPPAVSQAHVKAAIPNHLPSAPQTPSSSASPMAAPQGKTAAGTQASEWHDIVRALDITAMTRQLAFNCSWQGERHGILHLSLDPNMRHLCKTEREEKLRQALALYYQQENLKLKITVASATTPIHTPAQQQASQEAAHQVAAEQAIEQDPLVAEMKTRFEAQVIPGSISSHATAEKQQESRD